MNHIIVITIIIALSYAWQRRGPCTSRLYLLHFSVGVTRHDGVVPLGVPARTRAVQQQCHKSLSLFNGQSRCN
jgi:hypothetical protein